MLPKVKSVWHEQLNRIFEPKNRSCHSTHASIHLATQGTQHERSGLQLGGWPFALSSPHSGASATNGHTLKPGVYYLLFSEFRPIMQFEVSIFKL